MTNGIMIIGEAWGREEEQNNAPFVGPAGKLLRQMLRHAGISYDECHVCNVYNARPRKNNFGLFYKDKGRKKPTDILLDHWAVVQKTIKDLKPSVIVPVGAEALKAVTLGRKKGIEAWRGCPFKHSKDGPWVIPTYHPAAVLRQYTFLPIVELDLGKAERFSLNAIHRPEWDFVLSPTIQQVREWFSHCKYKKVSFDLESVGDTVRCIGFARNHTTICVPFLKFLSYQPATSGATRIINIGKSKSSSVSNYWTIEEEVEVISILDNFFKDQSIQKVGQNSIGFDQPFLEKEFRFTFNNHYFDCMHGFHLLYPELPKGLSFLCSVLTDYDNYWTGKNTQDDVEEWMYNCWDCIITLDVSDIIIEDLCDSGLDKLYHTHLHPLASALTRAQERGVLIDKTLREGKLAQTEKNIEDAERTCKTLAEEPLLNLNSHVQLKRLFYEKKRYPRQTNKVGKVSTNEECIKKLQKLYPSDLLLDNVLAYRRNTKIIDFLRSETNPDGRMPTSYNASGTETGRISSSKTIFGTGMNLMNVPKHLRDIFVAPEGRMFVKEDLSQAETRVVAELLKRHGDPTLWEKYLDPAFDIHTWMASCIYGKPEQDIEKHERQVGKLANHSGNYRAGPGVLVATALKSGIKGMDYAKAKRVLEARGRALPGLVLWWKWIEEELARSRTLTTCLGRRRIFFGRLDHKTYRDATAFEPQSIVGDLNNIIFRGLDRELPNYSYPLLQVHDEVVTECPEDKVEETIGILRKVGNIKLWINEDEPLIIPMDIEVGRDWKNCVEV